MINNEWGSQALWIGAGGSRAAVDLRGLEAACKRDLGRKRLNKRENNLQATRDVVLHPTSPAGYPVRDKRRDCTQRGGWESAGQVFINPDQFGLAGPLGGLGSVLSR